MRILLVATEAVPFCKVGGLADVVGSIYSELLKRNVDVMLALPYYRRLIQTEGINRTGFSLKISMGGTVRVFDVYKKDSVFFFYCKEFFDRHGIYGDTGQYYPDNALRFGFFSRAILEFLIVSGIQPDIIHLNDWPPSLLPLYLREYYWGQGVLKTTATVLTIHNAGYQGIFSESVLAQLDIPVKYFTPEGIEFYGKVNFLKAGILYSDLITTVSRRYAKEIMTPEFGAGLEGVFRKRKDSIHGILNGVNYEFWSPEKDPYIYCNYSANDLRGKQVCKKKLIRELSIAMTGGPLISFVGRLEPQKGVELFIKALSVLYRLYPVTAAILGSGDPVLEESIKRLQESSGNRLFFYRGFDEELAHKLYAGSDILVVPSRYEPCGLVQIIALRYGTIPVARATGGLADTIEDYNPFVREGTGFLFGDYSTDSLCQGLKRAFTVYVQKGHWRKIVRSAMEKDFSWNRSIDEYLKIYSRAKAIRHEHQA